MRSRTEVNSTFPSITNTKDSRGQVALAIWEQDGRLGGVMQDRSRLEMHRRTDEDATDFVVVDPAIRGGMPVPRGTRLGVYEIADMAIASSLEEILSDFPSLTPELVEHGRVYAEANPLPQEGPGHSMPMPTGDRLLETKTIDPKDL